ncbi:MAG: AAA family ATPase [Egibacteraceae bacterium]
MVEAPGTDAGSYPFCLPVVRALRRRRLDLDPSVTFLAGDNGTGKSTLVEAIAARAIARRVVVGRVSRARGEHWGEHSRVPPVWLVR